MKTTVTLLTAIVIVLALLGLLMLASASPVQTSSFLRDPFVKRQASSLLVGLIAFFIVVRIDYHLWRPLAVPLALFSVFLLVLVLVPDVGLNIKGSRRWIPLGPINMQPSEITKLSLILLMGWWMSRVQRKAAHPLYGLVFPLGLMGTLTFLVFIEPDFGTSILLAAVAFAMMFIGGTRKGLLLVTGVFGMAGFSILVAMDAERTRRILAFLNPEKYAKDEAFQLLNAIYAFVVGGATGVGLGGSLQKHHYLPEAHTDFIFAIIGEEMGLLASMGVLALFIAFFVCGLRISLRASDSFGRLVAFGITTLIALQAALNMGVVTGVLPTKGLPLPLISYGGTSLATTFVMVGLLVNIGLQVGGEKSDGLPGVRDRARRI
jgi:cell division protein FtsW